ncbi:MAG: Enoyl-CoA hydratase/isomerase, partial [Conexibacter sp.]|nr:Enoyl-CoA hydratase/isomerase [Conexibacter sp.]
MAVRVEVREDVVLWITLDAPEALNAFEPESMAAMADAWARLRDEPELRAGVITGAGERAFCVGSNLKSFIPRLQSGELGPRDNEGCYLKGPAGPVYKPVIAAVNGDCLGGGLELLTCADLRLSVPTARFGLPECRWGVYPGGGGTSRLPRQIAYVHAMDMLLTGRLVPAGEALSMGLVNRIVERDALDDAALDLALQVAGNGTLAVQAIKEAVARGADLPLEEAYVLESDLGAAVFRSAEAAEGLAAFAEKREP